ncbi:hypothetical protein FOA52_010728 [Chlamydomonas sp. UWO 241]|nr:hypothetical protein FOA52_010728 [Chlamydomonas sp. UWO 241]
MQLHGKAPTRCGNATVFVSAGFGAEPLLLLPPSGGSGGWDGAGDGSSIGDAAGGGSSGSASKTSGGSDARLGEPEAAAVGDGCGGCGAAAPSELYGRPGRGWAQQRVARALEARFPGWRAPTPAQDACILIASRTVFGRMVNGARGAREVRI